MQPRAAHNNGRTGRRTLCLTTPKGLYSLKIIKAMESALNRPRG